MLSGQLPAAPPILPASMIETMPSTPPSQSLVTTCARVTTAPPGSAVRAVWRAPLIAVAAAVSVAGLYLVKSAMGINLLPGSSPLHDLLYPLVR